MLSLEITERVGSDFLKWGCMYIPVFCEVKLLFLLMESGGFEESDITASVPRQKGRSDGELKRPVDGSSRKTYFSHLKKKNQYQFKCIVYLEYFHQTTFRKI